MQVHYNLLNGRAADRSRALLTVAPAAAKLTPLQTMLLPAPVELRCAAGEQGKLCNRNEALFDLTRKYGSQAAFVPAGLLILCRGNAANPRAGAVSTCDRRLASADDDPRRRRPHAPARRVDPGRAQPGNAARPRAARHPALGLPLAERVHARARGARPTPGDVVRVTCRHDVHKRMHGGHGIPKTPRYILWGEGTTDEMCLGILQVTRG